MKHPLSLAGFTDFSGTKPADEAYDFRYRQCGAHQYLDYLRIPERDQRRAYEILTAGNLWVFCEQPWTFGDAHQRALLAQQRSVTSAYRATP